MLIRDGFVTNSSSTSFLIISKDKLTHAYLQKKLGFSQKSIIDQDVNSFIDEIIYATTRGMEYFDISEINYEFVLKEFGKESADKFKRLTEKGYHAYIGCTNSDGEYFTSFMTTDCIVIEKRDFFMDGRKGVW